MKCKLCGLQKPLKKNTHYLTDSIIRLALNMPGYRKREQGFHFDCSSENSLMQFGFQRDTPIEKLREEIGRSPNEDEIERAKQNPFSSDYIFCSTCEDLFGEIEKPFCEKILPKFRKNSLEGIKEMTIDDSKVIRLFFYLQLYRTSVCDKIFSLPKFMENILQEYILNYNTVSLNDINRLPLSISYLVTSNQEFSKNAVGCSDGNNPYIILMNDFAVQFYDSVDNINFEELHGINCKETYKKYINLDEKDFVVNVLSDNERQKFLNNLSMKNVFDDFVLKVLGTFVEEYLMLHSEEPSPKENGIFMNFIVNDDHLMFANEIKLREVIREYLISRNFQLNNYS